MGIVAILIGGLVATGANIDSKQADSPPRLLSGTITNADYPASAIRSGAQGTVSVALTVDVSGRVTGCTVTGTSGNAALDSTTCALATRRFRYRPAMRNGRPVVGRTAWRFNWRTPM